MVSNKIDTEHELWLDKDLLTRHCLGIAATGGGKSNFLNLQLKQQMMRGGGCIHIDGKNSKDAIKEFLNLARIHDRWQDVRIINIDNSALSNTYNPLLRGDADELTTRIMALIPAGGDSFFRSQASTALRAITGVLRAMALPINFDDLLSLMMSQSALKWVAHNGPKDSRDYEQFMSWYRNMQEVDRRTGVMEVSEKKLQHSFGDLIGRLNSYNAGHAAHVLNAYNPEVDLYRAMQENLLIYVALPMLSKNEAAVNFAKLFISDMRTAIGQIQNEPYKPAPTFTVFMDEFSSYAMPSLAPVFEQARSANVSLFPFIQTISSLKDKERGLSEDFANKILGNTWSKISFVLKDPESCEIMSKIAGEHLVQSVSESMDERVSFTSGSEKDSTSMVRAGGRGRGYSKSVSSDYQAIARPEDFANLDTQQGEAIYIGKNEVLKLKVPYVDIPELKYASDEEALDFPRFKMTHERGLAMAEIIQKAR